jgi:hypothetical protein
VSELAAWVRTELAERLKTRRQEIEEAVLTRVYAVSDPRAVGDPGYTEGLLGTVSAAIEYGLTAIEKGEGFMPALPTALFAQAREASRHGVNLDTVLRRYFAGYTVLSDFVVGEAYALGLSEDELKSLLRVAATVFEQLLAAVGDEYGRERRPASPDQRLAERIERLLAGELVRTSDLAYDFEGWHLAVILVGANAADVLRKLATRVGCSLLSVNRDGEEAWGWLGSRQRLDPSRILEIHPLLDLRVELLVLGEPSTGMRGWRLTHKQAKAALPVALRGEETAIRYSDVAVLAAIAQDDLLAETIRELFFKPLASERDGGEMLRQTLRAYFGAGRNAASAAAALGVSRNTVASRLRIVEERIGRPFARWALELEMALRLEDLNRAAE